MVFEQQNAIDVYLAKLSNTSCDIINENCKGCIEEIEKFQAVLQKCSDPRKLKECTKDIEKLMTNLKEKVNTIYEANGLIRENNAIKFKLESQESKIDYLMENVTTPKKKTEFDESEYLINSIAKSECSPSPGKRKSDSFEEFENPAKKSHDNEEFVNENENSIDTKELVKKIDEFIKLNKISKGYFAKTVLTVSREYFTEVLNFPINWNKLSKYGKKIYETMNEFINDQQKIRRFLIDFKNAQKKYEQAGGDLKNQKVNTTTTLNLTTNSSIEIRTKENKLIETICQIYPDNISKSQNNCEEINKKSKTSENVSHHTQPGKINHFDDETINIKIEIEDFEY